MRNVSSGMDRIVWWSFLVWSAVGLIVMPWNPGPDDVSRIAPEAASDFLIGFLRNADAIWIFLAAANVYFWMIRTDGLGSARIQAAIIIVLSGSVEWFGQRTGMPFGPYQYTENFGPKIGGELPVAIPMAWLIIVICSAAMLRHTPLVRSRLALAAGVGLIATLTDINLEPVAWHVKQYWIWYPGVENPPAWPPVWNFLSWFGLSFVLTLLIPGMRSRPAHSASWKRPAIILGLINLLLAITHIAHVLRQSLAR